jgi:hypothetical protein
LGEEATNTINNLLAQKNFNGLSSADQDKILKLLNEKNVESSLIDDIKNGNITRIGV